MMYYFVEHLTTASCVGVLAGLMICLAVWLITLISTATMQIISAKREARMRRAIAETEAAFDQLCCERFNLSAHKDRE